MASVNTAKYNCHCCHKAPSDGVRFRCCSRCKKVFYCSPECQKKDWHAGHKHSCEPLHDERKLAKGVQKLHERVQREGPEAVFGVSLQRMKAAGLDPEAMGNMELMKRKAEHMTGIMEAQRQIDALTRSNKYVRLSADEKALKTIQELMHNHERRPYHLEMLLYWERTPSVFQQCFTKDNMPLFMKSWTMVMRQDKAFLMSINQRYTDPNFTIAAISMEKIFQRIFITRSTDPQHDMSRQEFYMSDPRFQMTMPDPAKSKEGGGRGPLSSSFTATFHPDRVVELFRTCWDDILEVHLAMCRVLGMGNLEMRSDLETIWEFIRKTMMRAGSGIAAAIFYCSLEKHNIYFHDPTSPSLSKFVNLLDVPASGGNHFFKRDIFHFAAFLVVHARKFKLSRVDLEGAILQRMASRPEEHHAFFKNSLIKHCAETPLAEFDWEGAYRKCPSLRRL